MNSSHRGLLLLLLIGITGGAPAGPLEPLGVVGKVQDAAPFYRRLLQSQLPDKNTRLAVADRARVKKWSGFGLYDSGLENGSFSPTAFQDDEAKHLITPICLVANDAVSVAWLTRIRPVLEAQNAICYLVKTSSEHDEKQLRKIVPNTPVVTLNPAFLIKKLGVPGYPVLISRRGVEQ